jgi:archaellum component FlaG (FlaF/FlaG flagellin family)
MVIGLTVVIGSVICASAGNPGLYIDSHEEGETVNSEKITVYGHVMSTGGASITSVEVNNKPAECDLLKWYKEVSLYVGSNTITVVATDETGNTTELTRTVFYTAPSPTPSPTTTPSIPSPGGSRAPSPIPTPTPTPTGSFFINTTPSGAKVYLDDSYKGITPTTLEDVTVGYHRIKVIKDGYHSETQEIYLCAGKTKERNIELTPLTGSIAVFSTPSEASVYLDDEYTKDTPCLLSEVVVGSHTIMLTKSDCFDKIIPVSVSDGKALHVHVNLTWCGSLDIFSDPPGASVFVDGNYTGETPMNISKVAEGNHSIKLTKFGYDNVTILVSVSAGEPLPVHVNLTGYGSLDISSDPPGASVFVDGNYTGETPMNISRVAVGNYSIRLTKSGYVDLTTRIQVSAGIPTSVSEPLSFTFGGRIINLITNLNGVPWWAVYILVFSAILSIFIALKKNKKKS